MGEHLPRSIGERPLATSPAVTQVYAELTSDFNPLHLDPVFAAGTPFGAPIVHGTMALNLLIEAVAGTLGTDWRDGAEIDVRFVAAAPVGSTLTAGGERIGGLPPSYAVWVMTQDGRKVVEGTLRLAVASAGMTGKSGEGGR